MTAIDLSSHASGGPARAAKAPKGSSSAEESKPEGRVCWAMTRGDLDQLTEDIIAASEVVMDLETTGLDEHAVTKGRSNGGVAARVSMAALTLPRADEEGEWDGQPPVSWVVPLSHPLSPFRGEWRAVLRSISETIRDHRKAFVNANVKFDARWIFATTGVDLHDRIVWDTQVSSHLLDENASTQLKERAPKTFGIPAWNDHDLSYPGASEDVDLYELGDYACIAEGQPVLTDRGPVPIERVTREHRLWDGVEWVQHEGVLLKGTQAVVTLDNGLRLTHDHLVLTDRGDFACAASIAAGARRASPDAHEAASRALLNDDGQDLAGAPASNRGGEVLVVRKDLRQAGERLAARAVRLCMSALGEVRQRPEGQGAERSVSRHAAALYARSAKGASARGQGDRGAVLVGGGVHSMGSSGAAAPDVRRDHLRPDRLERPLRARKSSPSGLPHSGRKSTNDRVCGVHGTAGCPRPSVALGEDGSTGLPDQPRRPSEKVATGPIRSGGDQTAVQDYARVYDILNAGPRYRFAVSGVIVSNCRDTWWTWRLAQEHRERMFLLPGQDAPVGREEVQDARLGKLATWVAIPSVAALTEMEQRGFRLDVPWVEARLADEEQLARQAMTEAADLVGMWESDGEPSFAPTSKWFAAFTERAVDQGLLQIGATTPTGRPQWSKSVLGRQQRSGSLLASLILDQRGATKRAEYLRSWLEAVSPEGFIHSTYWPGRVMTGRLSSTSPNMQQVTKQLRPAFIPREGYVIADWDYSQIELRVAAFISRSEPMMKAFRDGADLHRLIASRITGKPPEEVTAEERQKGKAANFGLLYMQSAYGFRLYAEDVYGVAMSEEEAQEAYDAFFNTWAGMREWHAGSVARVSRDGEVVSPLGRIRRLPDIWDGNEQLVKEAQKKSVNAPVQGFAADLLNMSAASIVGVLPGSERVEGARLVATVHDSLVGEVPADRWEEVSAAVIDRMEGIYGPLATFGVDLDVPLVAEVTVGTRWGLSDVSGA